MEKKEVLISVVVPVLNRAELVQRTLESISRQCYRPFELIIVDNGSTDGTLGVLEKWRDDNFENGLEIVVTQCLEPGAAAARNAGLAIARAPWIMFFDSDDTMAPTHLLSVANAIADNAETDIIGWDTVHVRKDGSHRPGQFFGHDMQRHNLFDGAMATQRWCARTQLVRSVGGWDTAVKYWDDIELGSRILAADPNITYIGSGGVHVYETEDSITAQGASAPARMDAALSRIEKTVGENGRSWCRAKRAIEYARASRLGTADGRAMLDALNPGLGLRLIFEYTRLGGRGAARFLKR